MKTRPIQTLMQMTLVLGLAACASQEPPPAATPVSVAPPQAAQSSEAPSSVGVPIPQHLNFVGTLDQAVTSFGAATTATHLYTLGGYFGEPHHYVTEYQSDRFARMDLKAGTWETLPSIGKMQSATLTSFGGRLYRVGGMRIDNSEGQDTKLTSVANVDVFDPSRGKWTALTPLPTPRSSHEVTFVGSKLYVVGGWNLNGGMGSGTWHETMLVADVNQTPIAWESVPMPFKARALGLASIGKRLYAIGGLEGRAPRKSVDIFDTHTGTWTKGPHFPEQGFGIGVTAMGGRLFASGMSGRIHTLTAGDSAWTSASRLSFPRFFHQVVADENAQQVLFVGGIPGGGKGGRIVHIEALGAHASDAKVQSWTIDSEPSAKNRQGSFLVGNHLYLFGGNNSLGQHDFAEENFLSESYRLDVGGLAWTKLNDFPRKRQSMQTVVTSHAQGVALGGFGMEEGALATRTEALLFDFEKEEWQLAEQGLPQSRTQFGLAEHGGQLWIFGGLDFDDTKKGAEQFVHPTNVLTADAKQPGSGFADAALAIPRPRRAFAGASLDGKYYMVGGMAAGFALVETCDAFTFETKQWANAPCPAKRRIGAEMVALDGKLYLIAGRSEKADGSGLEANDSIEVFDPASGTWSVLVDDLPIADTHQLKAFPFNGKLLIFSSQREEKKAQLVLVDPS